MLPKLREAMPEPQCTTSGAAMLSSGGAKFPSTIARCGFPGKFSISLSTSMSTPLEAASASPPWLLWSPGAFVPRNAAVQFANAAVQSAGTLDFCFTGVFGSLSTASFFASAVVSLAASCGAQLSNCHCSVAIIALLSNTHCSSLFYSSASPQW
eukprot:8575675-Lingulodinium_polyedra.AAC.1